MNLPKEIIILESLNLHEMCRIELLKYHIGRELDISSWNKSQNCAHAEFDPFTRFPVLSLRLDRRTRGSCVTAFKFNF